MASTSCLLLGSGYGNPIFGAEWRTGRGRNICAFCSRPVVQSEASNQVGYLPNIRNAFGVVCGIVALMGDIAVCVRVCLCVWCVCVEGGGGGGVGGGGPSLFATLLKTADADLSIPMPTWVYHLGPGKSSPSLSFCETWALSVSYISLSEEHLATILFLV